MSSFLPFFFVLWLFHIALPSFIGFPSNLSSYFLWSSSTLCLFSSSSSPSSSLSSLLSSSFFSLIMPSSRIVSQLTVIFAFLVGFFFLAQYSYSPPLSPSTSPSTSSSSTFPSSRSSGKSLLQTSEETSEESSEGVPEISAERLLLEILRNPKKFVRPQMEEAEIKHLFSYLTPELTFLEWGSGGSTQLFPRFVQGYYSVEHNREWCFKVNQTLREKESKVNYHCSLVDPSPEGWDGIREGRYSEFQEYVDIVDTLGVEKFDVVLVDGRARLACALKILPYLKPSSVVILHDVFLRDYSLIWKYYSPLSLVFSVRGMVALRPRYIFELPIPADCEMGATCEVETTGIEEVIIRASPKEDKMKTKLLEELLEARGKQATSKP